MTERKHGKGEGYVEKMDAWTDWMDWSCSVLGIAVVRMEESKS